MNSEEHSFIRQIKRAKVTDEEKAVLCCALAEGKPFKARNGIGSYLMALIHLEWRDFKEIREDERKIIIQLLKTKEMRCKGHGENCDWNNAIDFVIKKLSAKDD